MYDEKFLSLFKKKAPHFVISTHRACDGDGLGAGLALYYALKSIGQKASFFTMEKPHSKYSFMDRQKIIQIFDLKKPSLPPNSLGVFVDVNDSRQIEPLYSSIKRNGHSVYFIDHHPLIQKNKTDHFFVDEKASSSAELIYSLLKKLQIPLDEDMATCLFTSIVFDTHCFRCIKNSPEPFAISAEILPKIKDVNLIYENLFKNLTKDKLHFMENLKKTEYHFNNKMAFLHLTEEDFTKYKTDITQAYDLIDMIKDVDTVEVAVLLVENNDESLKLSFRSQSKDILPLAQNFGGGGHCHSAGASIPKACPKEIKAQILTFLENI